MDNDREAAGTMFAKHANLTRLIMAALLLLAAVLTISQGLARKDTRAGFSDLEASANNYFAAAASFEYSTGLIISDVEAAPGCSGATITWTTDRPASSTVEWSSTMGGPYTESFTDSTLVTAHSVIISGMAQDATWYYRVSSADPGGSATSPESSFTTTKGSKPALSLTKIRVYWADFADYSAHALSVDYRIYNAGPNAYGPSIVGTANSNGVTGLDATAMTDIPAGGFSPVTIKYYVSPGVAQFTSHIYATASDACGNWYDYPGPFPGA